MLLLSGRDEEDGDFRYAPGKWSAKELLGHVSTTMIYTHVLDRGPAGVLSPLDRLPSAAEPHAAAPGP